jgi:Glycosyl hydrolases family 28/Pectate lyase superfamily protein
MSKINRRFFLNSLAAAGAPALALAGGKGAGAGLPQNSGSRTGDASGVVVFNVKDYGATGVKSQDAREAIQKAIDACAAAGGGMVYMPPGEYTTGGLVLRSHVRIYLEAGCTLFASGDPKAYGLIGTPDTAAVFQGEDVENITIEGRGVVDGQHKFFWTDDFTEHTFSHKKLELEHHGSIQRTYPVGFPKRRVYPHLVWVHHCKDVQITGLSFLRSPSWTFYLNECERVVVDAVYIETSRVEAVWCDGIDMNGCNDVRIANCTILTGDDCIAIFSTGRVCENVTITNCRFSSASAGIKFTEGIQVGCRNFTIDNCVISDCNRGITLQIVMGGYIQDVIISNLTIDLQRYAWFWAGDGNPFNFEIDTLSEWNQRPPKPTDPGPGLIRNVMIRNVIAHVQGMSRIAGHPRSWLEGISFENIRLFISSDPKMAYDTTVHAMEFRYARNLNLNNLEVVWGEPSLPAWQSALHFEDIDGLEVSDFRGRQAWPEKDDPAVGFKNVRNARLLNSQAAEETSVFLGVEGEGSKNIMALGNDLQQAKVPFRFSGSAQESELKALSNFLPVK